MKNEKTPTGELHSRQTAKVNAFTRVTGIMAAWCESCNGWFVQCPECSQNWCGGYCECGYNTMLDKKQAQLDEVLLTLEGEK